MLYYNPYWDEIKDERIELVEEQTIENTKFILLYLHPKDKNECSKCKSTTTISFGKKKRKIKMDIFAHYKTDATMIFHRFQCKECMHIFNDTSPIVSKDDTIARTTKFQILQDLKEDISFTYIAKKNNISIQSVINIFESFINPKRVKLPYTICMDEFANLRSYDGKYAFLMLDPLNQKIIDVLVDRRQSTIDDYLYSISFNEKNIVKYVVTDMNESFRSIIQRHFPSCTHVIDTFHFLRPVEKAFNNVRIRVQRLFNSNSKEYRILKKHWRVLSAYSMSIDDTRCYNPLSKSYTTVNKIISDCLELSKELYEAYDLCQSFLKGVREVKYENAHVYLNEWISTLRNSNLDEFKDLADMFVNWKKEIINSFIRFGDRRLHNGYIEGLNNRVKVIKRIGYGYQNFHHFRARLMYAINDDVPYTYVDTTLIPRKPRKKKEV